jgi:hypothetical protein
MSPNVMAVRAAFLPLLTCEMGSSGFCARRAIGIPVRKQMYLGEKIVMIWGGLIDHQVCGGCVPFLYS